MFLLSNKCIVNSLYCLVSEFGINKNRYFCFACRNHVDINVSSGNFLFLTYAVVSTLSAAAILICSGKTGFHPLLEGSGMPGIIGYGITNCSAELLSLAVMTQLPASVQFAVVSGGVILFSAVISMLRHERQGKLTILSMVLSIGAIIFISI